MLIPCASMLSRPEPFQRKLLVGASSRAAKPAVRAKRMSNVCAMTCASGLPSRLRLRKREGHDGIRFPPDLAIAARRDDHVLAAICPEIRHGRGLAARGQFMFPELTARLHIERAHIGIKG